MKGVRAALDRLVELPAGRVSELRRKLILQHSKVLHCIVRHLEQRTGHALTIVVDTLDREVIVSRALAGNRWSGTQPHTTLRSYASVQQRKIDHTASCRSQRRIRKLRCR